MEYKARQLKVNPRKQLTFAYVNSNSQTSIYRFEHMNDQEPLLPWAMLSFRTHLFPLLRTICNQSFTSSLVYSWPVLRHAPRDSTFSFAMPLGIQLCSSPCPLRFNFTLLPLPHQWFSVHTTNAHESFICVGTHRRTLDLRVSAQTPSGFRLLARHERQIQEARYCSWRIWMHMQTHLHCRSTWSPAKPRRLCRRSSIPWRARIASTNRPFCGSNMKPGRPSLQLHRQVYPVHILFLPYHRREGVEESLSIAARQKMLSK